MPHGNTMTQICVTIFQCYLMALLSQGIIISDLFWLVLFQSNVWLSTLGTRWKCHKANYCNTHSVSRRESRVLPQLSIPIRVCFTWSHGTQYPVTKVTSDDITMMTSWWNTSRMLRMSKTWPKRLISYQKGVFLDFGTEIVAIFRTLIYF